MGPLNLGRWLGTLEPRVGNGWGLFSKIIGEIKENLLGTVSGLRNEGNEWIY